MNRIIITIYLVLLVLMSSFSLAEGNNVGVDTSQGQSQTVLSAPTTVSQGGHVVGPLIHYGKNNVNVGSVGNNPYGTFVGRPNMPISYKNAEVQSPNNANSQTLFAIFPESADRAMIEAYRDGMREQDKDKGFFENTYADIQDSIKIRPTVFKKEKKINKLWVVPGIWKGLEENNHYLKIATVTAYSESRLPFKQDLLIELEEWGLDHGANIIVPIFSIDGAELSFNNSAGAFSGFSSFAQVITSSLFGVTLNPSGSYSVGSNSVETKAFLGVLFLKVKDPEQFHGQAKIAFAPKKEKPELIVETEKTITNLDRSLIALTDDKEIREKRFERSIHYLKLYQATNNPGALLKAKDDLEIIISTSKNKVLTKECHFYLSSIYAEIGNLRKPGAVDRYELWAKAGVHANEAGMPRTSKPPKLNKLVLNH